MKKNKNTTSRSILIMQQDKFFLAFSYSFFTNKQKQKVGVFMEKPLDQ